MKITYKGKHRNHEKSIKIPGLAILLRTQGSSLHRELHDHLNHGHRSQRSRRPLLGTDNADRTSALGQPMASLTLINTSDLVQPK